MSMLIQVENPCLCSCGKPVPMYRYKARYGGMRIRQYFLKGHYLKMLKHKGQDNYSWRGGKYKTRGYIMVYSPDHPQANQRGYIFEHRLVYEQYYNCCLLPWIDIHHKNEIRDDNRIENLEPIVRPKHASKHYYKGLGKMDIKGRSKGKRDPKTGRFVRELYSKE